MISNAWGRLSFWIAYDLALMGVAAVSTYMALLSMAPAMMDVGWVLLLGSISFLVVGFRALRWVRGEASMNERTRVEWLVPWVGGMFALAVGLAWLGADSPYAFVTLAYWFLSLPGCFAVFSARRGSGVLTTAVMVGWVGWVVLWVQLASSLASSSVVNLVQIAALLTSGVVVVTGLYALCEGLTDDGSKLVLERVGPGELVLESRAKRAD